MNLAASPPILAGQSTAEGLAVGEEPLGGWFVFCLSFPPGSGNLGVTCCWVKGAEIQDDRERAVTWIQKNVLALVKRTILHKVISQKGGSLLSTVQYSFTYIIWSNPILWSRNCLQFTFKELVRELVSRIRTKMESKLSGILYCFSAKQWQSP